MLRYDVNPDCLNNSERFHWANEIVSAVRKLDPSSVKALRREVALIVYGRDTENVNEDMRVTTAIYDPAYPVRQEVRSRVVQAIDSAVTAHANAKRTLARNAWVKSRQPRIAEPCAQTLARIADCILSTI